MIKAALAAINAIKGIKNAPEFAKQAAKRKALMALIPMLPSFLLIIVIIGVVSYMLGNVQLVAERAENLARGGCIFCSNEELAKKKEEQFKRKINIIEKEFGGHIDKVVLASTVLFQGDYYEVINAEYDENFDEESFTEKIQRIFDALSATGSEGYDGIKQREIDWLDSAAIIMYNSNVDGKYNEENYKKALMSPGFGSGDPIINGTSCAIRVLDSVDSILFSLPIVNLVTGQGNMADAANRVFDSASICQYGFIEGTFTGIRDIKDENVKNQKKKEIANNIIEFSKFYKYLFGEEEDACSYGAAGSGEITDWRQYDDRWGSVSIGTSNIKNIGCTATSMAYLIAKSGTDLKISNLNPGTFVQNASFQGNALVWNFDKVAPNFKLTSSSNPITSSTVSNLKSVLSTACNGHHQPFVILELNNPSTHWVALDHFEGDTAYVMDPAASGTGLSTLAQAEDRRGQKLVRYNTFCANDVDFGTSKASESSSNKASYSIAYNTKEYQDRLNNLSNYYQCNYSTIGGIPVKGTTLCKVGCGTASLMGAYYLYTGTEFDTTKFVNDAIAEGYLTSSGGIGSKFDAAGNAPLMTANWGLSGEAIGRSINDIVNTLKTGKKILYNIGPNSSALYHSNYGHFILLDHYNESSNSIYVFDPNGSANRNGYKTIDELNQVLIPYMRDNPRAISSQNVNISNMCSTSVESSVEGIIKVLGLLEGVSSCTMPSGSSGYKSAFDTADMNFVGKTTAFGITQATDLSLAESVGYTNFQSDMSAGCADKKYIDQMVVTKMQKDIDTVKGLYTSNSGGKTLKEYQYQALALVWHHYPVGAQKIINGLAKLSNATSYKGYRLFVDNTGLKGGVGFLGGVRRREVEFHLFYNGNYNITKDESIKNPNFYLSRNYYNARTAIYKGE